jgi:hypothetical protein
MENEKLWTLFEISPVVFILDTDFIFIQTNA